MYSRGKRKYLIRTVDGNTGAEKGRIRDRRLQAMKIGEAAKKAGISPGNIRFYEKKGLLKPAREESSSYRNYTEEDVDRLKRILILRKTDLSVENISLLLDGKEDPGFLLKKQEEMLENQMRELEGSLLLCRKLGQEKDLLKADPEKYLQFIQKEEQEGRRFSPAEELLGELSDFTAECYGGSGWFTAVFGSWADLVKLILGVGLWLFFLYMAAVRFMEEPASVSHIVFWTGLFLAYNLSFLKYWASKRRTTQ